MLLSMRYRSWALIRHRGGVDCSRLLRRFCKVRIGKAGVARRGALPATLARPVERYSQFESRIIFAPLRMQELFICIMRDERANACDSPARCRLVRAAPAGTRRVASTRTLSAAARSAGWSECGRSLCWDRSWRNPCDEWAHADTRPVVRRPLLTPRNRSESTRYNADRRPICQLNNTPVHRSRLRPAAASAVSSSRSGSAADRRSRGHSCVRPRAWASRGRGSHRDRRSQPMRSPIGTFSSRRSMSTASTIPMPTAATASTPI